MKEEDIIRKLTEGKENPFVVPDGYFDDFTARLTARLPETRKKEPRRRVHVWRYAAVLLVAFGVGLTFLFTSRQSDILADNDGMEQYQEDYINDALDYALISNSNIELYLTEAY